MARRGCQHDIARKVLNKKADYILALKGNQGSLREDVEIFVPSRKPRALSTAKSARTGRSMAITTVSRRITTVIHDVEWLQERHDWPGSNAAVMVESSREISGKIGQETRFYTTSLVMLAHLLRPAVRSHWAIENSLHWVVDMIFRDAASEPIMRRPISGSVRISVCEACSVSPKIG